jgi:hypothetical protein
MIEPSAAAIPWMFATGNHEPELFSSRVAADHVTVANYEPIGYGGHSKRLDFPGNGPSACPSVYTFRYGNVTPAPPGHKTTMTLRFINQQGRELDRVIFSRIAGNP